MLLETAFLGSYAFELYLPAFISSGKIVLHPKCQGEQIGMRHSITALLGVSESCGNFLCFGCLMSRQVLPLSSILCQGLFINNNTMVNFIGC